MLSYAIERLLWVVVVLFCVSVIAFFLIRLRGDPIQILVAGEHSLLTPEQVEMIRHHYGFDKPVWEQYIIFLRNATKGDFGTSFINGLPALDLVGQALPKTLQLAFVSLVVGTALGIPLGVTSALRRNSVIDLIITSSSTLGIAMPPFWFGIMLILLFACVLKLLPAYGSGTPYHLVLPSLALSLPNAATIARLSRSMLLEELGKDFVRTARAKGLAEWVVIYKHTLRNALIPVVTQLGMQLGWLLGGSVVIETVFGWPGLGRLMIEAIGYRDLQVIQAGLLFFSSSFVIINLLVDLSYGWLDPRIRYA